MQQPSFSEDFTVVHLSPRQWARLADLWDRPKKKHQSGGWQDRLDAWKASSNPMHRTVLLSHMPHLRRLDDMTFIAHQIEGKLQGTWQADIAFAFEDSHPRFSGLTIRPRKR